MIEICTKELHQFFVTPMGYITCGIYVAISSLYYYAANLNGMLVSLSYDFQFQVTWLLMFLLPMLTMRLLAEERRMKTDQLLLTAPISVSKIVVGKFLAAMGTFFVCTTINLVFYGIGALYSSDPLTGELLCYYTGMLLLGGSLISVNLLISALTESQLVAAFAAIGVNVLLMVIRSLSSSIQSQIGKFLVELVSVFTRFYQDFARGIFSIPSVFYYLSFSALFIFLTIQIIEKRRWS